jgi:hypothetical protein
VCAGYADDELELIAGFLRRTIDAGRGATGEMAATDLTRVSPSGKG